MMARTNQAGEIALPFRIMPSRGRELFVSILVMLMAPAAVIGGVIYGASVQVKIVIAVAALGFAIFGFYFYRKERRYFDPGASYWMLVSPQSITLVTPDASKEFAWSDLASFVVTRRVSENRDEKTGTTSRSVSYSLAAKERGDTGRSLKIDLGDFATCFDGDKEARAEAIASALNDLRQFCRQDAVSGALFPVPSGLVVAAVPHDGLSDTRAAGVSAASVVENRKPGLIERA